MDRQIIFLTFDTRIRVGTDYAPRHTPWGNARTGTVIDLSGARLDVMHLSDSDDRYENIHYADQSRPDPETEQVLTQNVVFGSGASTITVPAGTQMTLSYLMEIHDDLGNRFFASFPHLADGTAGGTMLGDRYSTLIFPQPTTDSDGNQIFPELDLNRRFTIIGRQSLNISNHSTVYTPLADSDCLATGTLIETARGPRPVETLRAGDRIVTRDGRMRRLRWIGGAQLSAARLDLQPNLRPIRIAAGALGPGMPSADLTLSPQHRVLVGSAIVRRMFDVPEALVAVKHLLGLPGIRALNPPEGIGYWHLLFDRHEIVRANGAWAESLLSGPQAMKGLGPRGRAEVLMLFPEIARPDHVPTPARRILTGREGRKLAERLGRKGRQVMEPA